MIIASLDSRTLNRIGNLYIWCNSEQSVEEALQECENYKRGTCVETFSVIGSAATSLPHGHGVSADESVAI